MLIQGVFPDRLKYATVIPLYKRGEQREYVELQTGITFDIFFLRYLKRILLHCSKYKILSNEQYGFRSGLKTEDAIYKLTTEILKSMNNKLPVGGIFFAIWRRHSTVWIMGFCCLN
jgi:hypothetical protein